MKLHAFLNLKNIYEDFVKNLKLLKKSENLY